MQTPSQNEVAAARRVLEALKYGRDPSLVDAVLLRLWIGRRAKTPLAEIATAIIEAHSKQEHSS
jgi:hypothetical protein